MATKSLDKAQKEQAILQTASLFFARDGYRNTDVQAIADEVGVGKGTIYRYFGNKEALFRATANAAMEHLVSELRPILTREGDPIALIKEVALAYCRFYSQHPHYVEILIQERAEFRGSIPDTHLIYRAKNRSLFEDLLQRAMALGLIRKLDVNSVTTAFANTLYGTVVCGCLQGQSDDLVALAVPAIDLFLTAIQVDNGVTL
ncbi:MAG: TetR/AcrR family transcriptional regulator [Planctomycetota bacterium]|nr:TetR/AcrR family transcriptional regulator [Planctomycetota bacterium]